MSFKESELPEKEDGLQDLLIAYLDGELDESDQQKIESELVENAELRDRLHQLQRTWDLLDELPRPEVGNSFTQSTIEIAVSEARLSPASNKNSSFDWVLRVLVLGSMLIATGLIVFRSVDFSNRRSNRELLSELPIIDNVDIYLQAQNIEFLIDLHESGAFDSTANEVDEKE